MQLETAWNHLCPEIAGVSIINGKLRISVYLMHSGYGSLVIKLEELTEVIKLEGRSSGGRETRVRRN